MLYIHYKKSKIKPMVYIFFSNVYTRDIMENK